MAACLITITGTTGSVVIRYTLDGIKNSIVANFGSTVYVDDSVTDVTYTNLSGDAGASSGCITIDNLLETCYLFTWETPKAGCDTGNVFDAILLGETVYTIDETSLSLSFIRVGEALESLAEAAITPWSGKFSSTTTSTTKNYLIVKILGEEIPYLRIKNTTTTFNMYLKGVESDCSPVGYTLLDACQISS